MKNMKTSTFVARALLLALPAILLCGTVKNAAAADYPPERMSYQGYLTDSAGVPLGNIGPKNYDVVFRIWADQFGTGNRMWAEQQTITVDKGYFSVLLGEGVAYSSEARPLLSSVFAPWVISNDRFIDITVKGIGVGGADATIAPRVRFLSSPFAFFAGSALNATNSLFASYAYNLVNGLNAQVITIPTNGTAVSMSGDLNVAGNVAVAQKLTVTGRTILNGTVSAIDINASSVTAGGNISAGNAFIGRGTIPIGGIIMFSGATAPSGWALCDGTQGTPDLRGRFVLASGSGIGLTSRTLGQTAGTETHTLSIAEMPAHTHKENFNFTGGEDGDNNYQHELYQNTEALAQQSTYSTGGNGAHNNMPPYYVLAFIMRVQ